MVMLLALTGCVFITPEDIDDREPATVIPTVVPTDPDTIDADGDGFVGRDDCDDTDPAVFPDAEEIPNQVDDDCDDLVDEGTIFFDDDGDGFCESEPCNANCGLSTCGGDCDDTRAVVYPGAEEICDGLSNDCNWEGDEFDDRDGDGWSLAQGDPDDDNPVDLPTDVTMFLASVTCNIARIEPGTFTMGCEDPECAFDEGPEHEVTITYPLLVMETEVQRGQWDRFLGGRDWAFDGCGPTCPVTRVSWEEAFDFADQINDTLGLERCSDLDDPLTCEGWRLPTESEWEWAARGNSSDPYAGGTNPSLVGWIEENADDTVHPSRLKEPNAAGLYDMTGNVWEWVWDAPSQYPFTPVTDPVVLFPTEPEDENQRILRGGSANTASEFAQVTVRGGMWQQRSYYEDDGTPADESPFNPLNYHGFRLVRRAP